MRPSKITLLAFLLLVILGTSASGAPPAAPYSSAFGPANGWITSLVTDPDSGSLYASFEIGGVFQSADQGRSWSWCGRGLGKRRVLAVALDPSGELLAAGETEKGSVEILGSLDRGKTWTPRGSLHYAADHFLRRLALVPMGGSGTLYLAAARELWKSEDRGRHWARVLQATTYLNAIAATSGGSEIFVGTAGPGARVLRSTDGGITWKDLQGGLPFSVGDSVTSLAVSSSQPPKVYAGIGKHGLFESTDMGETWRQPDPSFNALELSSVAVDARDPGTLYATYRSHYLEPFQVRISQDGGATWRSGGLLLEQWPPVGGIWLQTTKDTIYVLNGSDLVASTDRGGTWSYRFRGGLEPGKESKIFFSSGDPKTLHALVGQRAFKSTDGGRTWASFPASKFQKGQLMFHDLTRDPAHPEVFYAAGEHEIFKSSDGGENWLPWGPAAYQLAVISPSTVLAGAFGLMRTADAGATWTEVLSGKLENGGQRLILKIVPDPRASETIYTAVSESTPPPSSLTRKIYRSRDGGKTWAPLVSDARVVAFSPLSLATLYVVQGDHLLASPDGGDNFRQVGSFNLPEIAAGSVADLLVDGKDPATLYAVTRGHGLLKSTDGGATWNRLESREPQDSETEIPPYLFTLTPDPFQPGVFYASTGSNLRQITIPMKP